MARSPAANNQNSSNSSAPRRSSGTLFKPREQLAWEADTFSILSIDGGGIKGILPAAILAECEKRFTGGRSAGSYFDMIAGTSTGGIIALALGVGMKASDVLRLYLDHGEAIFPPRRYSRVKFVARCQKAYHLYRDVTYYRYERAPLETQLRAVFGQNLIGHSTRRLVVPSFDGFTEVHLFKTPHHPDFKMDWEDELVTAALATSAAPTYFSTFKKGEHNFADGGVWANNPVMNALVDALSCYSIQRRQVHILSLGCGDQEMPFTFAQKHKGGLWHWKEIISSAMHLQSQNAVGQAGLLIGRDQLLRINPASGSTPIDLDDYARASLELPVLAKRMVEDNADRLEAIFAQERPPYTAYHGPRTDSNASTNQAIGV
jgi:patatin-like phospholipase/acyl hydrolase